MPSHTLSREIRVLLRWLVERDVIKVNEADPESDYNLRHVGRDPVYFDLRLGRDALLSQGISSQIGKTFAECFDRILVKWRVPRGRFIGVAYGADPFAEALASRFGEAAVRVKKEKDGKFSGFLTLPPPRRSKFIIIENVTTSGESVIALAQFLHECKRGYRVVAVLSAVDRESGASKLFKEHGYTFASAIPLNAALNFLIEEMEFPKEPCLRSKENARRIRKSQKSKLFHGSS